MWQFSRHGSDYPKNDLPRRPELQNLLDKMPVFRNQVLENHRAGRGVCPSKTTTVIWLRADEYISGHLCAADVANLELWTINIPVALGGQLSPAGHDDHFNLGARYKARLPSLLDRQYNETDYVVNLRHSFENPFLITLNDVMTVSFHDGQPDGRQLQIVQSRDLGTQSGKHHQVYKALWEGHFN